jgi:hypothetical protein
LASITASIWEQAIASVPTSAVASALADVEALADSLAEEVVEVDEPPQPDSETLRAATAIGAIRVVVILDMADAFHPGLLGTEHNLRAGRAPRML